MALITPMTLEEARAHGARFGLEVTALEPVPHGSVNSNFIVELAGGGRAFLRVCEESSASEVEAHSRLLAHLAAYGVPTPTPRALPDGATALSHAGKPLTAFDYCPGRWICQSAVTPSHVAAVGQALARVHLAGEGYAEAPAPRFGPDRLRGRLVALAGHGGEIGDAVVRLGARLDELHLLAAGGTCVIHGDVFRDNVLWHDGRLSALLDFESASLGHPMFDLMVTLLAWCFGDAFDRDLVTALVGGYQAERALSDGDRGQCYDQARLGCVRFAITRITDYELRPRGMVVYKDFRRFLQRLDAIEALGRDRFAAWLGG